MIEKNEKEIMRHWKKDSPLVSVRCMVYNHVKYIADALDGFLQQETDFPFEVIVHDDASTDGSADVIREYEKKFPNIIKPIYEEKNLYSRNMSLLRAVVDRELKGKYIAVCEGDDYWCDSHKLKKTVAVLEENDNFSACTHNTLLVNLMSRTQSNKIMYADKDYELNLQDVLDGNDWHTSSVVCRREYWLNRPAFCFAQPGVGDFPLKVYLTLVGSVKRFGDVMSVYRYGTPNSWTKKTVTNERNVIKNSLNAAKMLCLANEWSKYDFDSIFSPAVNQILFKNYTKVGLFDMVKKYPYISLWNSISLLGKLKIYLRCLRNKCMLKDVDDLVSLMNDINQTINKKSFA